MVTKKLVREKNEPGERTMTKTKKQVVPKKQATKKRSEKACKNSDERKSKNSGGIYGERAGNKRKKVGRKIKTGQFPAPLY